MQRHTDTLKDTTYDLLVVGAGIYGACVARDAALRGLNVALIERSDFGAGTSHNSLKLIHGGLRYLQHFDFPRVYKSICERSVWLTIAPHLIRPLEFVIPTYGFGTRGTEALLAASTLYRLMSTGQNRGLTASAKVPPPRVISAQEFRNKTGGLVTGNIRGGATWFDGQMIDADRVLWECVEDAMEHGAVACNYVQAEAYMKTQGRIHGVQAQDLITGGPLEIQAKLVINTCGPWAQGLNERDRPEAHLSKCMNLVVKKKFSESAFGIKSSRKSDASIGSAERLFFFTPWKNRTVIGTSHHAYTGTPDACDFTQGNIEEFFGEIQDACPGANLEMSDVCYIYSGLTPAEESQDHASEVRRSHHGQLVDHEQTEGLAGLISMVGEKYTTARVAAEQVLDLAQLKLLGKKTPCLAKSQPLPGSRGFDAPQDPQGDAESAQKYGTRFAEIRSKLGIQSPFRLQATQAIQNEMAMCLSDVVFRRTDFAARDELSEEDLLWCAATMAQHHGWDASKKEQELKAVRNWPHLNTTELNLREAL